MGQLETLYTGPKMQLEERYASLLVIFFICVIFSPGLPFLWIAAAACFWFTYTVERWAFLRMYRLPPKYGSALAETASEMLPYGILIHFFMAVWTFSSPALFDYDVPSVPDGSKTSEAAALLAEEGRQWANSTVHLGPNATNASSIFTKAVY